MGNAPVLMVVGTASSVGKSLLTAALCRIYRQDGLSVAPFKAQNMSNNADVTPDGAEIGRSQAEQAAAAGVTPTAEMNPLLLKPQGDRTSQLVVLGRAAGPLPSAEFLQRKRDLWPFVEQSLRALRRRFDLVIAEGAGSPAEPNLRAADIVNMRVARHAGAVTLLVGDIDRGGVFAHMLGTLALLPDDDRRLIRGLVINRFRGDVTLLEPAVREIEARTGVPVLGTVPWIDRPGLAEEDAVALERAGDETGIESRAASEGAAVDVAVIRFPRIANFDDFDPLEREPGVRLRYVERAHDLGRPSLVVLPGTKATVADLQWLRSQGLDEAIADHVAAGGWVLGICGGFQMIGRRLLDPAGAESEPGTAVEGLGLIPSETAFATTKTTRRARGTVVARAGMWSGAAGCPVAGYEIHMGETEMDETETEWPPLLSLDGRPDGAVSADGRVAGTYLHGLFHNDEARRALLRSLGASPDPLRRLEVEREQAFDRLASIVRQHVDIPRITEMLGLAGTRDRR